MLTDSIQRRTDRDRRPRHVRYAEQQLRKGYRLRVDHVMKRAYWYRPPAWLPERCTYGLACRIVRAARKGRLGEFVRDDTGEALLEPHVRREAREEAAPAPVPTTRRVVLDQPYYSVAELMAVTGLCRNTVQAWGEGDGVPVGKEAAFSHGKRCRVCYAGPDLVRVLAGYGIKALVAAGLSRFGEED